MGNKTSRGGPLEEFTSRPRPRIAIAAVDLDATRTFYEDTLGCRVLAARDDSLLFDFFGCELEARRSAGDALATALLPRFGLVMGWEDWHRAVDHLNYIGVRYLETPRFEGRGEPGERAEFCIADPGGNCLGFLAYRHPQEARQS
jgi:extradiol dioxygenase family protein